MDIIEEAENYERGFYTGIMGYCDGRTLDSAVMIRFLEQEGENLIIGGGRSTSKYLQSEYNEMIRRFMYPFIETIQNNKEKRVICLIIMKLNNTLHHFWPSCT